MSKNIEMQVLGESGYETIYPVPAEHASSHASNGSDPINEIREQHNGLAQKFWRGTQAEYDALTTKDEDTMYIVTDASSAVSGDMLKEVYDTENKSTDIFKYVDTHTNNTTVHITADERNAWNAKLDSFTETDPTVPSWAKQKTKPSYTASEVGALPSSTVIPSKTSQLTNDSGYITGYTETDPTVPAWAKAASKPSYSAAEVGAIPTSASCNKNWNWSGQNGQPSWLWGSNDGTNMYVYNPSNFNVNYANSAGNANTVGGSNLSSIIASAQSGAAKIQTGSYVGTGTYGAANPCSLTFNFIPEIIIVGYVEGAYNKPNFLILMNPISMANQLLSVSGGYWGKYIFENNQKIYVTWNNNNVQWYGNNRNDNASTVQANSKDQLYYYLAIG